MSRGKKKSTPRSLVAGKKRGLKYVKPTDRQPGTRNSYDEGKGGGGDE